MSSSYLLDTHPLLWWLLQPRKLSKKIARIMEDPASVLHVSNMTLLEAQYLVEIGRIKGSVTDIFTYIQSQENYHLLPFDEFVLSETLGGIDTRDPFDRVIVGTALAYDLKLLTKDRWMHDQFPRRAVW